MRSRSFQVLFPVVAAAIALAPAAGAPLPGERETWLRGRSAHFVLFGNAGERTIAEVGRRLETLRASLSRLAVGVELSSPLPTYVYVFKDQASFRPFSGLPPGATGARAAVFVATSDANFVALDAGAADDPGEVVQHEYLHYVLHHNFPGLPLWLDEGIAEFYSTFRRGKTSAEVGRPVRNHVLYLRETPLIPLADLFAVDRKSSVYNERDKQGVFYAESWALVHFLFLGSEEHRRRVGDLLEAVHAGRPAAEAVASIYGVPLTELEGVLRRYVRQPRFPFATVQLGELGVPEEIVFAPMGRADVLFRLGDYLARADDEERLDDAEGLFRAALERDPGHAPSWSGLGRVALRRRRHDEAAAHFEKSLVLDPGDGRVWTLAGSNLLDAVTGPAGSVRDLPASAPPQVAKAREYLSRGLAIDPDQPEAYAEFGATFLFETDAPRPGIAALETARRMLPSRPDVVFNLLQLYAAAGERESAEALLPSLDRLGDEETSQVARQSLLRFEIDGANRLAEAGDLAGASERLRAVLPRVRDAELRARIAERIARLDAAATRDRQSDALHAAVKRAASGDAAGAVAAVEALLPQIRDPELREAAREILAALRRPGRTR